MCNVITVEEYTLPGEGGSVLESEGHSWLCLTYKGVDGLSVCDRK